MEDDPQALYIVSVDDNLFHAAEWSSRLRYELSKSNSVNKMYRFESWHFVDFPSAFSAVERHPDKEFIYFRINPSEAVMATYPQFLERELDAVRKRNCIVVYDADHTSVGNVAPLGNEKFPQPENAHTLDLIHSVLERRSNGKATLLSAHIQDVSALGMEATKELKRQITVLTGRCDRLDNEMETLQDLTQAHDETIKNIRAWVGRGKGLMGAIGKKAIVQALGLLGAGAGIKWLVDLLME